MSNNIPSITKNRKFTAPRPEQKQIKKLENVNAQELTKTESIKVCLQNARSIRSDEAGNSLEDFIMETNYNIYAITESWLPARADKEDPSWGPSINNYTKFAGKGREIKPGGGVVWYIRDDIIQQFEEIDTGFPKRDSSQVSHIRMDNGVNLICTYIAPEMPNNDHMEIFDYMSKLDQSKTIVLGDFNLPLINFESGSVNEDDKRNGKEKAKEILDHYMITVNYNQLITKPTHVRGGILDLVFVSDESLADDSDVDMDDGVIQLYGWDHSAITVTLNLSTEIADTTIKKRSLRDANWEKFIESLSNSDWQGHNADELQQKIRLNVQTAAEVAIPWKEVTMKKLSCERHLSRETKIAIGMAIKLKKIYKRCPSSNNLEKYRVMNAYKRHLIKRDGNDYAKMTVNTQPKDFWNFVNRRKPKNKAVPALVENGEKVEDDKVKAELIKDHLLTIFEKRSTYSDNFRNTKLTDKEIMPDITFTPKLVEIAVNSMKANSAPGEDSIPILFYKKGLRVLAEPLSRLFQMSYDEERWPEEWLHAIVVPLHKKGPRSNKANYRPISLMLTVAKIMEKCIKIKVTEWYKKQNKWQRTQHAFTERRSTTSCLLEQTVQMDEWSDMKDTVYTGYVAIDKAKAFDKAGFHELGKTMVEEGLPENLIKWQIHGLQSRDFRVKVGGELSSRGFPTSGILQGSCLSPYLWIMHMQSIGKKIQGMAGDTNRIRIFIYADDVVFVFRVRRFHVKEDEEKFQEILDEYANEAKTKTLYIHPDKSAFMKVGNHKEPSTFKIDNKIIPEVKELNVLGVWYNSKGNSKTQFEAIRKKVKSRVFQLRKIVKTSDIRVKTIVWDLIMASVIRYGRLGTKDFTQTEISQLQAIQSIWMRNVRLCPLTCPDREALDDEQVRQLKKIKEWKQFTGLIKSRCAKHSGPVTVHQSLYYEDIMGFHDVVTGRIDVDINIPEVSTGRIQNTRTVTDGGLLIKRKHSKPNLHKSFLSRTVNLINLLPQKVRTGLIELAGRYKNNNKNKKSVDGAEKKNDKKFSRNELKRSLRHESYFSAEKNPLPETTWKKSTCLEDFKFLQKILTTEKQQKGIYCPTPVRWQEVRRKRF